LERVFIKRDAPARLVLILDALIDNKPESPNVTKRWRGMYAALPDSPLKQDLARLAKANLKGTWQLSWLTPEEDPNTIGQLALTEDLPGGLPEGHTEDLPEGLSEESRKTFANPGTHSPEPIAHNPQPSTRTPSSLRSEGAGAPSPGGGEFQELLQRIRGAQNGHDTQAILVEFALAQYEGPAPSLSILQEGVGSLLETVTPETLLEKMWLATGGDNFLEDVRGLVKERDAGE